MSIQIVSSLRSSAKQFSRPDRLGKPALAAPVVLEVAVGFARTDLVEAEIELLDVGVLPHRLGRSFEDDAAIFHDVAMVGDVERHGGVLLDQQHGQVLLLPQPADYTEDLLDEKRRQAE